MLSVVSCLWSVANKARGTVLHVMGWSSFEGRTNYRYENDTMRAAILLIWGLTLFKRPCHGLENSQSDKAWRWHKRGTRKHEVNLRLLQVSPKLLSIRGGARFQHKAFQNKAKSQAAVDEGLRSVALRRPMNYTIDCIHSGVENFWHHGLLQVHENFLHLFWKITKATTVIVIPIALLVILVHYCLPSPATPIIVLLEFALDQLRTNLNRALLFPLLVYSKVKEIPVSFNDYNQVFRDLGMPIWLALLSRPVMDGILFRWAVKTCWDLYSLLLVNKSPVNSIDDDLRWSVLSSVLYAFSHSGWSLPPPSVEFLQREGERVLETGFLTFGGMSIYREHWNADIVKTLLRSQPLVMAIGRGVTSGILSWGLLCPLYAIHGFMASVGAQMAWGILGWRHVDTQILIRVLGRVFTPWSTPTQPTSSIRGTRYVVT